MDTLGLQCLYTITFLKSWNIPLLQKWKPKTIESNAFLHNGYANYNRLSQVLKGAVVVVLWQNEADVKCQMDIDSWGKSPLEIYTSASFRQRVAPTAPFNDWYFRHTSTSYTPLIFTIRAVTIRQVREATFLHQSQHNQVGHSNHPKFQCQIHNRKGRWTFNIS